MVLIGKSIKLEEKHIQELKKIGKKEDRNFSSLVRMAIDEFLERKHN